jgi:hypothetical protein
MVCEKYCCRVKCQVWVELLLRIKHDDCRRRRRRRSSNFVEVFIGGMGVCWVGVG